MALFLTVALFALSPPPGPGLTWDKVTVVVNAEHGQTKATADFPFRNLNAYPVRITNVEPSCHCTVASAIPDRCPPGGHGVIRAVMNIGGESGRVEKSVLVVTDANPYATELTFDVDCR